jgi:hypothetical protein
MLGRARSIQIQEVSVSRANFPPALPHGELVEVLPSIWFVSGTVKMAPTPMRFSRNMTILREPRGLVLVNSVRLSEAGLKALEALGPVTDVIRLAGFHGMDDPFYKDRYGARVWAVNGQRYTTGFDQTKKSEYFTCDMEMGSESALPIEGARLYRFNSSPPEGLLVVERAGGVVVSGDCLQNWRTTDRYFNLSGKLLMRMMGFIKPHNIGPGWLRQAKPPASEIRAILGLSFEHVLPSHGEPVLGGAKAAYQPAIDRVAPPASKR